MKVNRENCGEYERKNTGYKGRQKRVKCREEKFDYAGDRANSSRIKGEREGEGERERERDERDKGVSC